MLAITPITRPGRKYELRRSFKHRVMDWLFGTILAKSFALLNTAQTISGSPFPGFDNGQNTVTVYFTVVPSGNYKLGGDPLDLTQLKDIVKSSYVPLQVYLMSQKTGGNSGWWYSYVPGTLQSNGKMQVFGTGGSAGASHQELADATAYNSTSPRVDTDTIVGAAIFVRA